MSSAKKFILYASLLGALALVFAMYAQPDFLMMLANQVWGCF